MKQLIKFILSCCTGIPLILILTIILPVTSYTQSAGSDLISKWNNTGMIAASNSPSGGTIDLAYLHIVMFDAVNSIEGKYTQFSVQPSFVQYWASKEAAASAAAYKILLFLYPGVPKFLDSAYTSEIELLPDDSTTAAGIDIGNSIGERFISLRENDGRLANVPYTFLTPGPGVYQLTPGAPDPPATPAIPWVARLMPFSMDSVSQFRPEGPPALDSEAYARDFNEVKAIGSKTSNITAEQQDIIMFHTEATSIQYSRILREFIAGKEFTLIESARLFAQVFASMVDAIIAGVDAKYYYNFWRPVTAIHQADTDSNPDTDQDTTWQPYITSPNHQEYVSTHCCYIGAFAGALENYFGTSDIDITLSSNVTNNEHHFTNTEQLLEEMNYARIWGGMHFRFSNEDGIEVGRNAADNISQNKFKLITEADDGSIPAPPSDYALGQNYPNPFNPSTIIRFSLPLTGFVSLKVYDILGREAVSLVNEVKTAGTHEVYFNAAELTSGTYFYTINSGSYSATKKLILIK